MIDYKYHITHRLSIFLDCFVPRNDECFLNLPLPPPEGDRTHLFPSGGGQFPSCGEVGVVFVPLWRGQGEVRKHVLLEKIKQPGKIMNNAG
jgi:hypothetical protein